MHAQRYLGIYSECEAAAVIFLKALLKRHDILEQRAVHGERCNRRKQPTVVYKKQVLEWVTLSSGCIFCIVHLMTSLLIKMDRTAAMMHPVLPQFRPLPLIQ